MNIPESNDNALNVIRNHEIKCLKTLGYDLHSTTILDYIHYFILYGFIFSNELTTLDRFIVKDIKKKLKEFIDKKIWKIMESCISFNCHQMILALCLINLFRSSLKLKDNHVAFCEIFNVDLIEYNTTFNLLSKYFDFNYLACFMKIQ